MYSTVLMTIFSLLNFRSGGGKRKQKSKIRQSFMEEVCFNVNYLFEYNIKNPGGAGCCEVFPCYR